MRHKPITDRKGQPLMSKLDEIMNKMNRRIAKEHHEIQNVQYENCDQRPVAQLLDELEHGDFVNILFAKDGDRIDELYAHEAAGYENPEVDQEVKVFVLLKPEFNEQFIETYARILDYLLENNGFQKTIIVLANRPHLVETIGENEYDRLMRCFYQKKFAIINILDAL